MIEHIEKSLPYISLIGSVAAFCFTVYKYIDTKKNEIKNKRFGQFHRVFEWVAGRTVDGKLLSTWTNINPG